MRRKRKKRLGREFEIRNTKQFSNAQNPKVFKPARVEFLKFGFDLSIVSNFDIQILAFVFSG
jgi:hypothetical protein